MITISLCMILKDEEDVLDRCLSSVKGLVDEIIIVDTGSTDATKQIALQYTDQVFDFADVYKRQDVDCESQMSLQHQEQKASYLLADFSLVTGGRSASTE